MIHKTKHAEALFSQEAKMNQSTSFDILKLENQLCFRLYMVSRNMTRLYAPILEKFHLTYPQYIIILVLLEHGEMDFKELSEAVDLKTGTMTPILQRLEEIGYIHREKNPHDARKITISLTQNGIELKKELIAVPVELTQKIDLDETSYLKLIESLDALTVKLINAQS